MATQLRVASHRIRSGIRSLEMGSASRFRNKSSVKISARTRGGNSACDCGVQRLQGAMKPLRLRSASSSRQPRLLLKMCLAQAPSCGFPPRWRL